MKKLLLNILVISIPIGSLIFFTATLLNQNNITDPNIRKFLYWPYTDPQHVDQLNKELELLKAELASLKSTKPEVLNSKILSQDVKLFNKRLQKIEDAILVSPEKSLAVPILSNELKHLTDNTNANLDMIKTQIIRIDDWLTWIIRTILISIFGTGVAILIKINWPDWFSNAQTNSHE